MKRSILLSGLAMALFMTTTSVNATVWRVNSAPGSDAHFTTIQSAHDASATLNGDTLYIEGSATGVGTLQATKMLIIIGTGYFLASNPETQATPLSSSIGYIWFQNGSQGSKVMGCNIGSVRLYTSNILITRCYIQSNNAIGSYATNLANIVITSCYIRAQTAYNYSAIAISDASNVLISNCYVFGTISSNSNFSGIFTNNIFYGSVSVYNSVFKNNIHAYNSFSSDMSYNNVFTHNVSNNSDYGSANGNQDNVSMSTVFENFGPNYVDNAYMLRSGSPAIGAGEYGVDCGIFGGPFPYILSGMPNIPSVYYLNTPPVPSDVIDVAIKAKSHN